MKLSESNKETPSFLPEFYEEPPSLKEIATWLTFLVLVFLILILHSSLLSKGVSVFIRVDNISVSNFSTTGTKLDAVWIADVSFLNPHKHDPVQIQRFQSNLHKERDDVVACGTTVDAIELAPKMEKTVRIRFEAKGCGGNQTYVKEDVVKQITSEKEDGTVRLVMGMSMAVNASFQRESLRMGMRHVKATCPSLSFGFGHGMSDGTLISDPVRCYEPFR
ncbi:hypothetical protein FNV43_RR16654 [Rhamnella rubrinervis]|uniref:Uncharacterized protein n=1 Tax=Rhamnella rubrinervis TaxID=2594499 RepID=A0A8K0GZ63_9ROSA|nr:hypothetical protein FNV43_RR16654 [Rhamnella rubrinervis]